MRILVTGGAGFIGSHLVDALLAERQQVLVIDNLSNGHRPQVNRRARLVVADIRQPAAAAAIRRWRPQAVFHLAAQISVRRSLIDPRADAEQNIMGSLRLLELCRQYRVKQFIFSSSGGALYGDQPPSLRPTNERCQPQPQSPYGIAKWTVEQYLAVARRQWGLVSTVLRYANVYGPRQDATGEAGVVAIFLDALRQGKTPLIYGHGRQTRDYVYVADVVAANLAAWRRRADGVFNIGTGTATSVRVLFRHCARAMPASHCVPRAAAPVVGELRHSSLDARRARRQLAWQPTVTLVDGIGRTAQWLMTERSV